MEGESWASFEAILSKKFHPSYPEAQVLGETVKISMRKCQRNHNHG